MDAAMRQSYEQQLADVHTALIRTLLEDGHLPSMPDLAQSLQIEPQELTARLIQLSQAHGLVLHPHAIEPWVVHPFSTTPTLHYVEGEKHGWWAPCIWCAFGISQLAKGKVRIHTRLGAQTEPLTLEVMDGVPSNAEEIVVHFSVPPREAWQNVHRHCALVLPFRTQSQITSWCDRHGQPIGDVVTLETTARLARQWYGPYASSSWRKWTVGQAQGIFASAGLTSDFWQLSGEGTY